MENIEDNSMGSNESRPALPARESQSTDKELPKSPAETPEKRKSIPEWRANALPDKTPSPEKPSEVAASKAPSSKATSPAPSAVRLKIKVPGKSRTITVSIPLDEDRGRQGKAPKPLSKQDVANINRDWNQLGYDTTGFNLGYSSDSTDVGAKGMSRDSWPDSDDMNEERFLRNYRVNIPDKRKWDEYCNELVEAKLRAMGVSLPGEAPPPSVSPALPSRKSSMSVTRHTSVSISRNNSMQYPALPFSPPLPTGSAGSSHVTQHPNPFSPVFAAGPGPSTNQSSNVGSVASPISMQAPQFGNKYNPRQSVSFGSSAGTGEHPFGSPFQFARQASPGMWSPQMLLGQQGGPRGGSPAGLPNSGAFLSPSSPFSGDGYFGQDNSVPLRQQVLDAAARQSPRLQDLKEVDDLDEVDLKSPSKTPEANLLNRQHRQSASLQKEIDDAEYHLEEQFERQLDHEDYSPHNSDKGQAATQPTLKDISNGNMNAGSMASLRLSANNSVLTNEMSDGPILHHPQPHSRGHSLSQRPYTDTDDDSNAMNSFNGATKEAFNKQDQNDPFTNTVANSGHEREASNPWSHSRTASMASANHPKHSGHSSKASVSGLNVEAKEFKFNPASTFQPNQFAFNQNAFLPSQSSFVFEGPGTRQNSVGSAKTSSSRINPDAPVFNPGNSAFNFSASGPAFKPSVQPFVPGSTSSFGVPHKGTDSIFGNVNLADVVKQPKKSKAIPIVRPDTPKEAEDEVEDRDGRITRGASREKRARGDKADGDSIPLFATPSAQPLSETTREQSPPKEDVVTTVKAPDNKENAAPVSDVEEAADELEPPQTQERPKSIVDDAPDYEGRDWAPWESFHEAEEVNISKPLPIPKRMKSFEIFEPVSSDDHSSQTKKPEASKGHKKNASSVSATSKPFEFHAPDSSPPSTSQPAFGASVDKQEAPKQSTPSLPLLPKKSATGLAASRWARTPSPEKVQQPDEKEEGEISDHSGESEFEESKLTEPPLTHSDIKFLEEDVDLPHHSTHASEDEQEEDVDDEEASTNRDLSFEEIDERMRVLNEMELQSSPMNRQREQELELPPVLNIRDVPLSPIELLHPQMRSDAPSPSPRRERDLDHQDSSPEFGEQSSIFEESPSKKLVIPSRAYGSPIHRVNTADSMAQSDWNDTFPEGEEAKLESRSRFFDSHVNGIVGGILSDRLAPIERVLDNVVRSMETLTARNKTPSRRRARRSFSGELPQSDADDEDDEPIVHRSLSPRNDRRWDTMRVVIAEALAANRLARRSSETLPTVIPDKSNDVLKALEEMKEQFGQSMRLDLRGEDIRNILEEVVVKRLPSPDTEEKPNPKVVELEAKVAELTQKLQASEENGEAKVAELTLKLQASEENAESKVAEFTQKLQASEENREARIAELTQKLQVSEEHVESEIKNRRSVEDRMAELERLNPSLMELEKQVAELKEKLQVSQDALAAEEKKLTSADDQIAEFMQKLLGSHEKLEAEVRTRRAAEDRAAELQRLIPKIEELEIQAAELTQKLVASREIVEEEISNRRDAEDRVAELERLNPRILELETQAAEFERKLVLSHENVEAEIANRRAAEDRMAEVQRLLRISSEEEIRLRETLEENGLKLKATEDEKAKLTNKLIAMEAALETNQQLQLDALNRANHLETELLGARRVANGWQLDAERALEAAKRHSDDAEQANETNAEMRIKIEKLKAQMEESTRIREAMRGKFNTLQEDMSRAAREISEDNSRRAKKEQELVARQEVLDAKLQAEARTRERLEMEIERLEKGERDAMRAVSENRRLESLMGDLRTENHEAQMLAMKYKREFEEARESGLSEVQRTRSYMQSQIDTANHEVNMIRDETEHQVMRLRAELDQVRLDADTYKARSDMLLEEATEAKRSITEELTRRHERILEDMQTLHKSKLSDTVEEAHRAEQHLLERLSLSSAKTEHLQDRVSHLEEKLEIAQAAAKAAAEAARTASFASPPQSATAPTAPRPTPSTELPEKISPQALRESIMVLQEQLQDREQKIEKLEQSLVNVDLDAPSKISKRDDEITWLRELLGVRNADLQDIVNALDTESYDAEAVRDAAIRLRANLQMEQQERERAMAGGSAVNLPNIAAGINSIREAASPRIAQSVGSIAAAWGNWRNSSTPNKAKTAKDSTPSRSSLLSGLMTPPASTRTPTNRMSSLSQSMEAQPQPTAFSSTGRRLTAQQLVERQGSGNLTPRAREKLPIRNVNSEIPSTPPMLRNSSYDEDADARATDDGFNFSEDGESGFYDDEDATETNTSEMFAGAQA